MKEIELKLNSHGSGAFVIEASGERLAEMANAPETGALSSLIAEEGGLPDGDPFWGSIDQ